MEMKVIQQAVASVRTQVRHHGANTGETDFSAIRDRIRDVVDKALLVRERCGF